MTDVDALLAHIDEQQKEIERLKVLEHPALSDKDKAAITAFKEHLVAKRTILHTRKPAPDWMALTLEIRSILATEWIECGQRAVYPRKPLWDWTKKIDHIAGQPSNVEKERE